MNILSVYVLYVGIQHDIQYHCIINLTHSSSNFELSTQYKRKEAAGEA